MSNSSESYFSNSTKPPLKAFIPGAEEKYAKKLWEILSVADVDGNKEISPEEWEATYEKILVAHPKDSFKVILENIFQNKERHIAEGKPLATSGITKADCDEASATLALPREAAIGTIEAYSRTIDTLETPRKIEKTLIKQYIDILTRIDPNYNGATVGELMMNNGESFIIEPPVIPIFHPDIFKQKFTAPMQKPAGSPTR